MRISIVGNYKSNNAGDDFYLYLLRDKYKEHEFIMYNEFNGIPDFIIFGGGGILNPAKLKRINYVESMHRVGVPFCALSIGSVGAILPKRSFISEYDVLKYAKFITCRDRFSFQELQLLNSKTYLLPDLVWNYEPKSIEKIRGDKKVLGIMLRDCTKLNKNKHLKSAINVLKQIKDNIDCNFLFFNTYGEALKNRTMNEVATNFPDSEIIPHHNTTNMLEHLDNLRRCDALLCMAYHAIVLGCLYGVPVSGWIYESKIEELCLDLNIKMAYDLSENKIITNKITSALEGNYSKNITNIQNIISRSKANFYPLDQYLK